MGTLGTWGGRAGTGRVPGPPGGSEPTGPLGRSAPIGTTGCRAGIRHDPADLPAQARTFSTNGTRVASHGTGRPANPVADHPP
jgi:hypothetical protein